MKRILFAVVTAGLLTAATLKTFSLRECWAAEASEAAAASVDDPKPWGVQPVALDFAVAADSPFYNESPQPAALPTSGPGAASVQKRLPRTIKVPLTVTAYEPKTVTVYEERVVSASSMTPLQQQFCDLMLRKAQRMTDDELKSAIETVEAELKEQDEAANAELQKAVEILNKLKQDAGGTPAADRATLAIPILDGTQPPRTAPTPDTPFTTTPREPYGAQFQPPSNPVPSY